jgi:nonribosomal peptide synthetase DhbF
MTGEPQASRRDKELPSHRALAGMIAEAWCSVLGIDAVGSDDNFFDVGGSSLHVMEVKERLDASLDVFIPVIDFFRYPTVTELTSHLRRAASR